MTKDEIKALEAKLMDYKHHYYNGKPKVSDAVFDRLEDKLRAVKPNSPVLRKVGAKAVGEDVKLPYPILSLDKIKANAQEWLDKNPGPYVIMDKLDGYSMEEISDGRAWSIYTRGDGQYGKDKSFMAPDLKIPAPAKVGKIAVRAEALVSKAQFARMADNYEAYGSKKAFENERNAVGSAINKGEGKPNTKMLGALKIVAYEIMSHTTELKPSAQLKKLKALGFDVVWHEVHVELTAEDLSRRFKDRKRNSPYLVDGLVIAIDKPYRRATLTNPKYAVAYKEVAEGAVVEATVDHVEWRPSAHGRIVPRVHIKPVRMAGVTVKHFTGFNAKFIKDNKVGPGAVIQAVRSGDVIPYIQKVVKGAKSWQQPDMPWHWNATEVDALLDKTGAGSEDAVTDVKIKRLNRFFSHLGFDALKIGTLTQLYNAGLTTPRKILSATTQQLMKVEGVKDQKAMALRKAIQAGADYTYSWAAVGSASGMFGVGLGETKLAEIEKVYPNWERAFANKSPSTIRTMIAKVPGFQDTSISKFVAGLPKLLKFVAATPQLHVETPKPKKAVKGDMTGVNVLFTGFRNADITAAVESRGGKEVSTINQATVLVAKDPEGTSTKLNQARAKGVPIMSPDAFTRKYKL